MNIGDFKKAIEDINSGNWLYGNEILYRMASAGGLTDAEKLAGAMWLIGRTYAASPQRRNYGTVENNEGYIDAEGKCPSRRPRWPVRPQNDGRDEFFGAIARTMVEDNAYTTAVCGWQSELGEGYYYNNSSGDMDRLISVICAVLGFNLILGRALEWYDMAQPGFFCSHHVSFSSKLLHFFFPHSVFIVDSFAKDGGSRLFGGRRQDIGFDGMLGGAFGPDIFSRFSSDNSSAFATILGTVLGREDVKTLREEYEKRKRNGGNGEDVTTADEYIKHCVRSYLLGVYIKGEGISPKEQIRYAPPLTVESMPRLIDSVFLNIKCPLTEKQKDHLDSIERIYKIKYPK